MALGIFMAGWCLQLRQEAWSYPEAIAGALYLLSGAIFQIDKLPSILHPVAYALPTTWWLEASRRGLLGHGTPQSWIGTVPDGLVMLYLLVSTADRGAALARRLRLVHAPRPPGGAARHGHRELARPVRRSR